MAAFYTDADVAPETTLRLRALGHDVQTAMEAGYRYASDDEQLVTATRSGRILLTHNAADYRLLNRAWLRWSDEWGVAPPPIHPGIIVIPQKPVLSHADAAREIDSLVASVDTLANTLAFWRPLRRWTVVDGGSSR